MQINIHSCFIKQASREQQKKNVSERGGEKTQPAAWLRH
jgi:hypothetical protein